MEHIQILEQPIIDQIAAGEVVERPSSVVKELVENAIDAGATSVTVEIKEGGISLIRVTDNGIGIARNEVATAFLRHATSKLQRAEDLFALTTLGFRGEALSSIAAVSQVEIFTGRKEEETAVHYCIEGGRETCFEETAVSGGTSISVRQLFYNTPVRRKFLKSAMTEASHIGELLSRLALSRTDISFRFINNGKEKLFTPGNGRLKDGIYSIYGREVANQLIPIEFQTEGVFITGFLGKPSLSRGNRNLETYFINGRYVKNQLVSKAIEDAYQDFTMQHRYPVTVLKLELLPAKVDVNVHPSKLEVRFTNTQEVYNVLYEAVHQTLRKQERVLAVELPENSGMSGKETASKERVLQSQTPLKASKEQETLPVSKETEKKDSLDYFLGEMRKRVNAYHAEQNERKKEVPQADDIALQGKLLQEEQSYQAEKNEQLDLFQAHQLNYDVMADCTILGQAFGTYWLVQFQEELYIIDQHAAHERILYEQTLRSLETRKVSSQQLSPPLILHLSMGEAELLRTYQEQFTSLGFVLEPFGGDSYAVRAVPANLFSIAQEALLIEMLDELAEHVSSKEVNHIITEKIASLSCKAAVKGNTALSVAEVKALLQKLFTLKNPYHCPHGRPTMISMSRRELEKKFKRIV